MEVIGWQTVINEWIAIEILNRTELETQGLKKGDVPWDRSTAVIDFLQALLVLVQVFGIPEWILDILEPAHLEFQGTGAPDRHYDGSPSDTCICSCCEDS